MSDNIVLDDGRVWWSATIVVANVLYEIGQEVKEYNQPLSAWLIDVSDRPAPFMHFDIRGLSSSDTADFYRGASAAYMRLVSLNEKAWVKSNLGASFGRLLEMRQKIETGEAPEIFTDSEVVVKYTGEPINLNELWSNT